MRLPRDLSGAELVTALAKVEYYPTRQTGSHVRVTTTRNGEHHVTVPRHPAMKVGTLNAILREVGSHLGLGRDELLRRLFG